MGYSPFNPPVYLRAFAGCFGGLTAPATSRNVGDYSQYAIAADAFAQAVDTQWGPPTPTAFELLEIESVSEAYWQGRSPPANVDIGNPGSYTEIAAEIVAKVQEANAQVVAEGIDPGAVGGGGLDVTAGTSSGLVSTLGFINSNGVSFGLSGTQLTASVAPAPLASIIVSAGTSSAHVTDIVFSNSNSLSFGLSGSTITASAAFSQSTAPGAFAAGTQTATSGTVVFSNSNGISFGMSGSSVVTASIATSLTAVNVSAGTTSQNLSALTLSNANNVSFGLNGSVVTASATVVSTQGSVNLSAGTTSNLASAFTFGNANGVSFGLNASTLTASIATSLTNVNISAGTTSNNLSAITFSNANGVSFGLNGSVVTGSIAAAAAVVSVSLISQDADFVTNFSAVHGGLSLQRLSLPMNISATKLVALLDLEGTTNSSGAMTLSHGVYTLSGSTASLASSASRVFSWGSGSATSASSQYGGASGTRYRTVGVNYSLTPGDYLFAWQIQTGNSEVWNVIGRAGVNVVGKYDGAETALWLNGTSVSTFTTALPASIALTDTGYVRTGVPAMRQPGAILVGTF